MSTTLRWRLAAVAACVIGLALLLAGVALGRATGGVDGYKPTDARPNTYYGNSVPDMGNPSTLDRNGIMGPSMMGW